MLNRELIDREFGFMKEEIYLNISLTSLPPRRVQDTFRGFMDGYVRDFAEGQEGYFGGIVKEARANAAKLLQCGEDEVAFTRSTSDGFTILAASFPFKEGDNVVLTEEEHASNVMPWLAQERRGVEVRFAKSHDGIVTIQDILDQVDERTRIVSTASTYFCTGYRMDLKALSAELKKRGVYLSIDGIQSMGRLKIYPYELGVDYISAGSYKGMMGTKGAALTFCSRELQKLLVPYTGSQQGIKVPSRPFVQRHYSEIDWKEDARKFEHGNYTYVVIQSLSGGLSLINEIGIGEIDAHVCHLEQVLREKIAGLDLKVITPAPENQSGLMFVFYPEQAKPEQVKAVLNKYRIHATIRNGFIRMGFHCYNTEEQMDIIAKALAEISEL